MSLTERHPVLLSVWGFVSLVIAAILAAAWRFESIWVVVVMWAAVLFSPFIIGTGWQSARERWIRREQVEKDA
jgi:hypothetical protein